jgi:hypothetical protein
VGHLGAGAFYVEGWVVTERANPFVIEHGWCEVNGAVVDPSYTSYVGPYAPPVAYFAGARFDAQEAAAALARESLPIVWSRDNGAHEDAFAAAWREASRRAHHEAPPGTRVVHCRREPCDVFIGRPSKWAVPLHVERDGTREEVIAKFRHWFIRQPGLLRDVWSLRGKVLGCACTPLPCHGDVLADLADSSDDPQPALFIS